MWWKSNDALQRLDKTVMPAPAAPARPVAGNTPPTRNQEESTLNRIWAIAQQFIVMYLKMQLANKFFTAKEQPAAPPVPLAMVTDGVSQGQSPSQIPLLPTSAQPAWPLGIPLAMYGYLSTSPTGEVFSNQWTSEWQFWAIALCLGEYHVWRLEGKAHGGFHGGFA
ncbi:uncharacterized protein LAESUDRAFT_311577 [Laetiporus sulphureus 93-53]|uniref:Uncharacterized protein n=1 Tax=Laetiporus sulphureus 93-53 TaxID=1314785 RepID=A0A165D4J2_9APHY|nr:uncharacterized protein LAESUDRAFT_311577 [Laetiporus sulphureus 93-53]KZT04141.1 hypothetical protein LAESUDRAFT_311577 [Laetiporus sulphureus 93-53]